MTERSRPWDGKVLGDAGSYDSSNWRTTWGDLISVRSAVDPDTSVLRKSGDGTNEPLLVEESAVPAASVRVRIGSAIVQGSWYEADAEETVPFDSNVSGSTRIDRVVLRATLALQVVRLEVVKGTPGAGVPALTQSGSIWEAPIAQVSLVTSYTTILDAVITDERVSAKQLDVREGGTGILGGYTIGDLLVATGPNTLAKLAIGNDIDFLVADSGEASGMAWLDPRITTLWEASTASNAAIITNPMAMDSAHDPAGNLLVHASDKWELEPGIYQMVGGGFSFWNIDVSAGGNVYWYLYDYTAASALLDTDGATVRTIMSPVHVQSANTSMWLGQEFVIDGTESIGVIGVVSGTGFVSTDVRGGYGAARTIPWSVSFKRIK